MDKLVYTTASLVNNVLTTEPPLGNCLSYYEQTMCAFQAHRTRQLKIHKTIMKNLYDSNVDNSTVESQEPYLQNEMSSSQFQPLCNLSGEVLISHSETELTRSYLDCITPSTTTAGFSTIGDILTRQIEQSLDCAADIDVVNVNDDMEEQYFPVMKKPKINDNSSGSNNNNALKNGLLLEDYIADEVSPFYLVSLIEIVYFYILFQK